MWLVGETVEGNTLEYWVILPGGRWASSAALILYSDGTIDELLVVKEKLNKDEVKPITVFSSFAAEFA